MYAKTKASLVRVSENKILTKAKSTTNFEFFWTDLRSKRRINIVSGSERCCMVLYENIK